MTETLQETPATFVKPDEDSRLDQLLAQYELAKAEADKAAEAFETIKNAIKHELMTAAPGVTDVRTDSSHISRPLRLHAVTSWRVEATKLKAEQPAIYAAYAKQSTAWRLDSVKS